MKKYITKKQEETRALAKKISQNLDGHNVLLLRGNLGAGKTTFAQGFLQAIGAKPPFTSPTFVIMKKYPIDKGQNVFHFDCYRIKNKDVLELGWKEIIENSQNLILVEWPENIENFLPSKYIQLDFKIKGENERVIEEIRAPKHF